MPSGPKICSAANSRSDLPVTRCTMIAERDVTGVAVVVLGAGREVELFLTRGEAKHVADRRSHRRFASPRPATSAQKSRRPLVWCTRWPTVIFAP